MSTFSKINIYKPIPPDKIKFFKDSKSPSLKGKETSALKGFVERSQKDSKTTSNSLTAANSTNANSAIHDCLSVD
jgi:hypothetical protein